MAHLDHKIGSLTPGNAHTLSVDEVREALIQIAIYAGVPRANHALKIAKQTYGEMEVDL